MKLAELAQLRESLNLLLSLTRVQVLLHFLPFLEKLVFFDLSKAIIHAGESFQK